MSFSLSLPMTKRNDSRISSKQLASGPAEDYRDSAGAHQSPTHGTVAELVALVAGELQRAGVEEFQLEARLLLGSCLKMTRSQLFLRGDERPTVAEVRTLHHWLARRKQREPLAYILGEQEFWSLPFLVSPAVLIPRPETEFLLDRVLALGRPENFVDGAILDLCCGSGVIATVLARETGRSLVASDLSGKALAVARDNLIRHQVKERVALVAGDLFAPFACRRQFSLLVSNPPYVGRRDIANFLEPEVADYEPHLALDGGDSGLAVIERIRAEMHRYLLPGGELFMEIGADQGREVAAMFSSPWKGAPPCCEVAVHVDYAGRDRVVHARLME